MERMDKSEECKGKCPKCGSDKLDYGAIELEDDGAFFPFTCQNCDCCGEEWYNLEYIETTY